MYKFLLVRAVGIPSRRRSGISFTEVPVPVLRDTLDEDQLKAIRDDRYLQLITDPAAYEEAIEQNPLLADDGPELSVTSTDPATEPQTTPPADPAAPGGSPGPWEDMFDTPIGKAIRSLDPKTEGHFTKGGLPELSAIQKWLDDNKVEEQVTAAKRDAVWQALQEYEAWQKAQETEAG